MASWLTLGLGEGNRGTALEGPEDGAGERKDLAEEAGQTAVRAAAPGSRRLYSARARSLSRPDRRGQPHLERGGGG